MRKIAITAGPGISFLALALVLGCTGHDTYETYYIEGGSAGELASSVAGRASGGANASGGASASGSDGQGGANTGNNGQAGADDQAGASSLGSDGGETDAIGGAAGDVGAVGGSSSGGSSSVSQAGSPAGGEAGSACSPCSSGKKCRADTDCASYACDAALHTCTANQCQDHQQDGLETDTDCGGGLCQTCAMGKSCLVSFDCASQACDGLTLVCVSDVCSDHRKDGVETDVDCGGGSCASCTAGKKCGSSFDCVAGHVCNPSKICQ